MRAKELRSLGKEELKTKLSELRKEMIKHNAQIAIGTMPKSPGQIKQTKKTIAKILTIINEPKKEEKKAPIKKQEAVKPEEKKTAPKKKKQEVKIG